MNDTPLVHLHEPGPGPLTRAHDLLGRSFRVVTFDASDRDAPPDRAAALAAELTTRGIETFDLLATGRACPTALALAIRAPARVRGLVLESPTAGGDPRDLSTPTLVLCGTMDRSSAGRDLKACVPGSHLVFVYAAGPEIAVDRPEAFADVVTDFLRHHDAFVISRADTVIHP